MELTDGIDHINIYSKGKTEIGRWMSNFVYSPIETEDGDFCSIEGYWYWLLTRHDELREKYGFGAKEFGRSLLKMGICGASVPKDFKDRIRKAVYLKANNNPSMVKLLRNTSLPLTHYYQYGEKRIYPEDSQWLIDIWEDIRKNA